MKIRILVGIACLLLAACTRPRAPAMGTRDVRPGAPTVAIQAVTVVDVTDGSLLPERTVLIAGNRIVAVGTTDDVRIPRDAELVEAAGRYLIPGLWDMHVHSVGPGRLIQPTHRSRPRTGTFPCFSLTASPVFAI